MLGKKNLFRILLGLSFLSLVFFTGYFTKNSSIDIKYHNIKNQVKIDKKVNVISKLKETLDNNDIIALIKIEGTSIDEIVVKSADNKYYLNHNPAKEEDKYGATFMDYRNSINDKKLLIYGHNSRKTEVPFHELEKFVNKEFYDDNKNIELVLGNEIRNYIIFSVIISHKGNYKHTVLDFESDAKYEEHIKWMKDNSVYNTEIEVNANDEILSLQTCYYKPEGSYLIINAKRKERQNN